MKDGIIGIPDDKFSSINSFDTTRNSHGYTLHEAIQVGPAQTSLAGGSTLPLQQGRALAESTQKISVPSVNKNGNIKTNDKWEKVFNMTEFVIAPGEFVVVDDTSGIFLFDILQDMTGVQLSRPSIDLDAYAKSRSNATPWKYGFDNAGGKAEKGIVYGSDVVSDPDMGKVLSRSDKNQLGLEFSYNASQTKMEVSETG